MLALANIQQIVVEYEKNGAESAREKYDEYRNEFSQSLLLVFNETWKKIKNLK